MKRLECLDGLRGVLAVYVLLGHMAPFGVLPDWLQLAVSHGGAAVDVFFILSGLVITQSLSHAHGLTLPFLAARAARIFPVFLPVFALSVAVAPLPCGFDDMPWIGATSPARTICGAYWPPDWLAQIIAHLTMTHGLFPKLMLPDVWVSFLGSSWSLSTEWQFYLLALLVWRVSAPSLVPGLLALSVIGLVWQVIAPEPWQFSRALLANKAHFFALGVASVAVVQARRGAFRRYGLTLAACLAVCFSHGAGGKMLPPLIWTLCLAAQLWPRRPGLHMLAGMLRSRIALFLGAISYSIYLINEPVHKLIAGGLSHVVDGDAMLFTALWLPAAIGLPILAAAWLHKHVERPALRWGRVAAGRLAAAPAAAAAGN